MAKDIRQLFDEERNRPAPPMGEGHESRFLQKLDDQLPAETKSYHQLYWLRVVAASVLIVCLGWAGYSFFQSLEGKQEKIIVAIESQPLSDTTGMYKEQTPEVEKVSNVNRSPKEEKQKGQLTLSDVSPDLKKVETFFVSSINIELANLKATAQDQDLLKAYLEKMEELGDEYDKLTQELNTIGVNEMTIAALIDNLKIRMQLLQRLKKNLNHSKKENHEKKSSDSI